MKFRSILSALTLGLLGCNTGDPKIIDLSDVTMPDGFVDVPLSIVQYTELDNYFEYNCCATLNMDTLGVIVRLKKDIPIGFINGEPANMFIEDGIEFISKGTQSDDLLRFLAREYGLQDDGISLKDTQTFTCANLNQDKPNYKKGVSKFKIFLEDEKDYSELYVNFNFSQGTISLNEKDEEYREPLIQLMKQ